MPTPSVRINDWNFYPDNPYGITFGENGNPFHIIEPQFFTDAVALGISRIRVNIGTYCVVTAPGVYTWAGLDDLVQKANIAGIRVTLIARSIGNTQNAFTVTTPCGPNNVYLWSPASYTQYAIAICQRYSGDGNPNNAIATDGSGKKLQVDNIEVGNEEFDVPLGTDLTCRNPMRYVYYARAVVPKMRASVASGGGGWNPHGNFLARIGQWGAWWRNQTHIRNVFNSLYNPPTDPTWNAAGDHSSVYGFNSVQNCQMLDYINFHNYSNPAQNVSIAQYGIDQELQDIQAIQSTYGDTSTPIWVTEFGVDGPCAATAGAGQAAQETALAASQSVYYASNTNGTGIGALNTLMTNGAQHCDIFTMNYSAPNSTSNYVGQTDTIAAAVVAGGFTRFTAFTTIANFIALNPTWPFGFPGTTTPFTLSASPSTLAFYGTAGGSNPANQTVTLSNTGGTSASYTAASSSAWLIVSPTSGSVAATSTSNSTISVSLTGLVAGSYTGSIIYTAGTLTSTVNVSLTLTGSGSISALTVYLTNAASTTLATGNKLYTLSGNPATIGSRTKLGTAVGYGEVCAQSITAWVGGSTLPAQDGRGFFLDTVTLDNQQLVAGAYSAAITMQAQQSGTAGGSLTANLYLRVSSYTPSTQLYTTIFLLPPITGQVLGATASNLTFSGTSAVSTSFAVGDRLYIDFPAQITVNANSNANQQIAIQKLSTDTSGLTGSTSGQIITPGFQTITPPVLPSAYAQAVQNDAPQAYYRLDETSGTSAFDATGNADPATYSGTFTLGQAGAIIGDSDTACSFGTNGLLAFPYTLNYTGWTAFTLEYWINQQNTWNYVAVTAGASGAAIVYLNGNAVASVKVSPIEISALFDWAGSYATGTLDEVAVYNVALPGSSIAAHYIASGRTPSGGGGGGGGGSLPVVEVATSARDGIGAVLGRSGATSTKTRNGEGIVTGGRDGFTNTRSRDGRVTTQTRGSTGG